MLFPQRNAWVDPRVVRVKARQAQEYLERHGWRKVEYPRSEALMYAAPGDHRESPQTQIVPLDESARDYVTCITTLIGSVANNENRYAVDVLNEMLGVTPPTLNGSANGHAAKELVSS